MFDCRKLCGYLGSGKDFSQNQYILSIRHTSPPHPCPYKEDTLLGSMSSSETRACTPDRHLQISRKPATALSVPRTYELIFLLRLRSWKWLPHCSLPWVSSAPAAIPYSAVRCISNVRIWISNGCPLGPISVVCKD